MVRRIVPDAAACGKDKPVAWADGQIDGVALLAAVWAAARAAFIRTAEKSSIHNWRAASAPGQPPTFVAGPARVNGCRFE